VVIHVERANIEQHGQEMVSLLFIVRVSSPVEVGRSASTFNPDSDVGYQIGKRSDQRTSGVNVFEIAFGS
jgi:hypothetical protein